MSKSLGKQENSAKKSTLGKNNLVEIEPMEKFCKRENVFFTDQEKVNHQIEVNKFRYKNFKQNFEKAFSHFSDIPDHPDFEKLLREEEPGGAKKVDFMELPDENIESWRRPAYVYQRPKTKKPSLGSNKLEIRENYSKNNRKIA